MTEEQYVDPLGIEEDLEPIEDDPIFPAGSYVSVDRHPGVAWTVRYILDDRVVCRMVAMTDRSASTASN